MGRQRSGGAEAELEALARADADPAPADRDELVLSGLSSKHAVVVARAAQIVRDGRIDGFEDRLVDVYARLVAGGAKADTGCHAKVAILEALDHLERNEPEPFLSATSCVQLEKGYGPPEDSAQGVRVRGALALVRMRYDDALLVLARLVSDTEATVRGQAAEALAHHGDRNGAALLIQRLVTGEPELSVLSECIRGLCALAPDHARAIVEPMLRDDELRELAAHAIVAADRDEAVAIVLSVLDETVLSADRRVLLQALGVSRRAPARDRLLELVARGRASDAEAAVRALAVHAYDPRVVESVRAAAADNEGADLAAAIADAFDG